MATGHLNEVQVRERLALLDGVFGAHLQRLKECSRLHDGATCTTCRGVIVAEVFEQFGEPRLPPPVKP